MEIVSTIVSIVEILIAVKEAIDVATEFVESVDNFVVTFRKTVDDFKNTVTEVVVIFDSDGDGENDREEVVYRIYQTLPDYETGLCICNKGNEIGLGLPMFEIIDGRDFADILAKAPSVPLADSPFSDLPEVSEDFELPEASEDLELPDIVEVIIPEASREYPVITGNDKYKLADLWDDGYNEVFTSVGDLTGDGIDDIGVIVDRDNNGLPDASPNYEFYPIGSEAFEYFIESTGHADDGILTKKVDKYSVTEGLLALILLLTAFNFIRGLFGRSDYFK